jgi:lysophospholipase L1-like esterase
VQIPLVHCRIFGCNPDAAIAAPPQILPLRNARRGTQARLTVFHGYYQPEGEAKREAVNAWIPSPGSFDAVIDFDAAVRDPPHQTRIRPEYDVDDHLHPNDAGYRAMGDAVGLSLFQ